MNQKLTIASFCKVHCVVSSKYLGMLLVIIAEIHNNQIGKNVTKTSNERFPGSLASPRKLIDNIVSLKLNNLRSAVFEIRHSSDQKQKIGKKYWIMFDQVAD